MVACKRLQLTRASYVGTRTSALSRTAEDRPWGASETAVLMRNADTYTLLTATEQFLVGLAWEVLGSIQNAGRTAVCSVLEGVCGRAA